MKQREKNNWSPIPLVCMMGRHAKRPSVGLCTNAHQAMDNTFNLAWRGASASLTLAIKKGVRGLW